MKALGDYLHAKGFKFGIHKFAPGRKPARAFPAGVGMNFRTR
jgi:hypothetical protein